MYGHHTLVLINVPPPTHLSDWIPVTSNSLSTLNTVVFDRQRGREWSCEFNRRQQIPPKLKWISKSHGCLYFYDVKRAHFPSYTSDNAHGRWGFTQQRESEWPCHCRSASRFGKIFCKSGHAIIFHTILVKVCDKRVPKSGGGRWVDLCGSGIHNIPLHADGKSHEMRVGDILTVHHACLMFTPVKEDFVVFVKVMKKNKRERDEDSVRHGDQYDTQLLWFLMRHMRNRRPQRVSFQALWQTLEAFTIFCSVELKQGQTWDPASFIKGASPD